MPDVSRTRATFRNAELGFFGVVVNTRVQTPRRCGEPLRAGVLVFSAFDSRPLRTSWAIVGTRYPSGEIRLELENVRPRRSAPTRSEPTGERSRANVRPPRRGPESVRMRSSVAGGDVARAVAT